MDTHTERITVDWDHAAIARSEAKGASDRWGVQDARREGDWLLFGFDQRRIYAPLERLELPGQFARVTEDRLLAFVQTYGRLGWNELAGRSDESRYPWLATKRGEHETRIKRLATDTFGVYAEPIEWLMAHAATVRWCLEAGAALRIPQPGRRQRECERLADALPRPSGQRGAIGRLLREDPRWFPRKPKTSQYFVGKALEDYLWINLEGVRRRVHYSEANRQLRTLWGGESLLESIYTLLADAVTGGDLGQCEACGAPFVRTHKRQRFCPPRQGQEKSSCMNRLRVQRWRANRPKPASRVKRKGAR